MRVPAVDVDEALVSERSAPSGCSPFLGRNRSVFSPGGDSKLQFVPSKYREAQQESAVIGHNLEMPKNLSP